MKSGTNFQQKQASPIQQKAQSKSPKTSLSPHPSTSAPWSSVVVLRACLNARSWHIGSTKPNLKAKVKTKVPGVLCREKGESVPRVLAPGSATEGSPPHFQPSLRRRIAGYATPPCFEFWLLRITLSLSHTSKHVKISLLSLYLSLHHSFSLSIYLVTISFSFFPSISLSIYL